MKLARPAPRVEPAVVDAAEYVEAAVVREVDIPSEPVQVEPARRNFSSDEEDQFDDDVQFVVPFIKASSAAKTLGGKFGSAGGKLGGGYGGGSLGQHFMKQSQKKRSKEIDRNASVASLKPFDFACRSAVIQLEEYHKKNNKFMHKLLNVRNFVPFGEVARYVVIKGTLCFVYLEETDLSPLYTFDFTELVPTIEDREKPDVESITINPSVNTNLTNDKLVTVLLRHENTEKLAYQVTIDTLRDQSLAIRFVDTMEYNKAHRRDANDTHCEFDDFSSVELSVREADRTFSAHFGEISLHK